MAVRKKATKTKAAKKKAANKRAKVTLAQEKSRLERNKKLVIAFYQKLIGEKDAEAARRFMGEPYVQHSPMPKTATRGWRSSSRASGNSFRATTTMSSG